MNEREVQIMNNIMKALVVVVILAYIVSPVDLVPGPIDDIIVALLGLGAARKQLTNKTYN